MITISPSELTSGPDRSRLDTPVDMGGQRRTLWYSVGNDYAPYLVPGRVDHCLVPLLPLAMLRGEDIRVEGALSERLYYNLTRHLTRILSLMYPRLRPVRIQACALDSTPLRRGPGAVVTGFTGGIDSSCVLAEHHLGHAPEGFRITHCLFNNMVAQDRDLSGAGSAFRRRLAILRPVLEGWRLPLVLVDSNLHEFFGTPGHFKDLKHVKTHTLRNSSCALLLQKFFGRFLYASAYAYEDCRLTDVETMGYGDPYVLHLLGTESLECISTGCQYSRAEKTALVAGMEDSRRFLTVCTAKHAPQNCSVCTKCVRTLLTLEILGRLDDYAGRFDLEKYRKVRGRFVANLLSRSDPLSGEIVKLAKAKGFRFSPMLHLAARLGLKNLLPGKHSLKL